MQIEFILFVGILNVTTIIFMCDSFGSLI